MAESGEVTMELGEFTVRLRELVNHQPKPDSLLDAARDLVAELAGSVRWLGPLLERLLFDREFLDGQMNSIWSNEFSLWRSPDGDLSVLAYIWEPGAVDVVHDHGSWGIVGGLVGNIEETRYVRLDDGLTEGYADLRESSRRVIDPGEAITVLPLNKGIHCMANKGEEIAISVNVYGRSVQRGYVRFFDVPGRTVRRALPPRNMKRLMAIQALGVMGEPWAAETLQRVSGLRLPDPLREECERSLERLKG
jgi:predicted metal-dependent enzyme (double-stranded beta helix superfamily)